jgi:hypothetical protein
VREESYENKPKGETKIVTHFFYSRRFLSTLIARTSYFHSMILIILNYGVGYEAFG